VLALQPSSAPVAFLTHDHLGSVREESTPTGELISRHQYDPWGASPTGAVGIGWSFTGREAEPEVGLHYYRSRYYAESLGRFVSADPIGMRGGVNLYAYVLNRPTVARDPSGQRITINMTLYCSADPVPDMETDGRTTLDRLSFMKYPCQCRSKGNWGFNVDVTGSIGIQFRQGADPNLPSAETPGLTLCEHEGRHSDDLSFAFAEQTINSLIKTEGFGGKEQCRAAWRSFDQRLGQHKASALMLSWILRDLLGLGF
jgi:RHS repeat-associated protein